MRRSSVGSFALAALILLSAAAPATASATSVQFSRGLYVAPLDQAFPAPITVTVKDDVGAPRVGVEVAFSVTPDSTGATASISAPTATTDGNGVAQITGTAGSEGGFPVLRATVDGASAGVLLVNRPPGYRPGEQLASIVAQNQDGVTEDVRDGLGKHDFVLVDVCAGWCGPCRFFAQETQTAIIQLATLYGVKLKLATLLKEGDVGGPSVQADAQSWNSSNGLSDSVLHAGGSFQSELYRGASFFMFDNDPEGFGAFPTHLLVDSKGNILDRLVGAASAEETVARVLAYTKTKDVKPPKVSPVGEVGVQLPNGELHSDLFSVFDAHFYDWGAVALFGEDVDGIAQRIWYYVTPGAAPLPASGALGLSLTRFKPEAKQPLTSTTVPVYSYMQLYDGALEVAVATTLPAVQNKDTVTVTADLAELRAAIRAKIEAGEYEIQLGDAPTLTPELIDALVNSLFAVAVEANYTIK
jgi:hypothetical protein